MVLRRLFEKVSVGWKRLGWRNIGGDQPVLGHGDNPTHIDFAHYSISLNKPLFYQTLFSFLFYNFPCIITTFQASK